MKQNYMYMSTKKSSNYPSYQKEYNRDRNYSVFQVQKEYYILIDNDQKTPHQHTSYSIKCFCKSKYQIILLENLLHPVVCNIFRPFDL